MVNRILALPRRLRHVARFRLWVWRTRSTLAQHGCSFEIDAPHGVAFITPPTIELNFWAGGAEEGGEGSLRIELGEHVSLGRDMTIEVVPTLHNHLSIGGGVVCGNALRLSLYGGRIGVGHSTHLRDGVLLKSRGRLDCGAYVLLARNASVTVEAEVLIGDRAGIAENCSVLDSDHVHDGTDTPFLVQPVQRDPVRVGPNVWIGANSVVLKGARLAPNSVVAAGSVVRAGDYPAGWLIAGAPAEPKRPLGQAAHTNPSL